MPKVPVANVVPLSESTPTCLAAGQGEHDIGPGEPGAPERGGPVPITSSRTGHLWDALSHAYDMLGFEQAARRGRGVPAARAGRIIEPV